MRALPFRTPCLLGDSSLEGMWGTNGQMPCVRGEGVGSLVLLALPSLYEAGTILDDAGGDTGSGKRSQQMAELGFRPCLL